MRDRPPNRPDRPRPPRDRQVTETIRVASAEAVPDGYVLVPVNNPAIFSKAQVLSARHLKPIFIEESGEETDDLVYWVHELVLPELVEWIRLRVFPDHEL